MRTLASRPPVRTTHRPVKWGSRTLHRPVLTAVIAGGVGAVAVAGGAGLGFRYLVKTGPSASSGLGLALLVGGLVLLGFAGGVAWRAAHRWQRLWLVPVAVAALLVIWSTALGVAYAVAPRTPLGSLTPASRGLAYHSVAFRTADGVPLAAWYIPATNHAAVVLMPGAGSTRTATLGQAAVLARHGFGALMVDPRGQGRSGGRAMDIGWYGDRDITAAVTFLQHQRGTDASRVAVLGLSMGGEEAIGAAAADPDIRAVVAEGATTRTAQDKSDWLPGGVAGTVQRGLDRLTYGVTELLSPAPRPIPLRVAIARSTGTPFLLITAGTVTDETRAATAFRAAAPDRVQIWMVPGAGHTHGLTTHPDQWAARVTSFLDQALGLSGH